MFAYILITIIALINSEILFASECPDYYEERTRFNRGYLTQVLSNFFGSQSDLPTSENLELIQKFQKDFKDFPDEPKINDFDKCGMAPLHYLSITRIDSKLDYYIIKKICNILVELGADINLPNKYGVSPLKLAASYGNYAVVDEFLKTGKLKKDLRIFDTLLSGESDSEWQLYREEFLCGKVRMWILLQKAWLSTVFSNEELSVINFCTDEMLKLIEIVILPPDEFLQNSKTGAIKIQMKTIYNILEKKLSNTSEENFDIWNLFHETQESILGEQTLRNIS